MQGKILASGIISAQDGNRYTYEESELKNSAQIGDEVDFIIKDEKACEIYSLVNNKNHQEAEQAQLEKKERARKAAIKNAQITQHLIQEAKLEQIRTAAYIGSGCYAASMFLSLLWIGILALPIGAIFMLIAYYKLTENVQQPSIFRNALISYIAAILPAILLIFVLIMLLINDFDNDIMTNWMIVFSAISLISYIIYTVFITILDFTISSTLNVGAFKIAAILRIISSILFVFAGIFSALVFWLSIVAIVIGFIVWLVSFICKFIAWTQINSLAINC